MGAPKVWAAPVTLVAAGKSPYSIVIPQKSAESVLDAAVEMQRAIKESTGVELPIRKDTEVIPGPVISLGATSLAKGAGVTVDGVADEGFRMVTAKGNLYILGPDTTTIDLNAKIGKVDQETINLEKHPEIPGPAFTKNGGFSNGTANGVYCFLEQYLGVRWLMPGDLGRDVPSKTTFVVEDLNRVETPLFSYRVLPLLGASPGVYAWRNQMRLGFSYRINHRHSTKGIIPAAAFEKNPDWFAMDAAGKRIKPSGKNYQLELTNPEVVNAFTTTAVTSFKAQPELNTFSVSPSDGGGFSQSPESKALYDPAPPGSDYASITPLILNFYRDVCKSVARQYPEGKISGYLYSFYRNPPQKGGMELPKNFVPVLTAVSSGYMTYREDRLKKDVELMEAWGKVAPEDWFYYCFPTWLGNSVGMVTPPSADNLNYLFSGLVKNRLKGAFYYGTPTWSQAAISNYIAAQMLWNPKGDAKTLEKEWLTRAYGPKAGAVMLELYDKMDASWFADYFRQPDAGANKISEAFYSRIYGAHYPEMEKLVLNAAGQPMTNSQKARLDFILDNMRVLQFRLRQAGYLKPDYHSPLTIGKAEVFDLVSAKGQDFDAFPNVVSNNGAPVTTKEIRLGEVPKDAVAPPNTGQVMVYAKQAGEIRLKPLKLRAGSNLVVYYLQNEAGKRLQRGLLGVGDDIVFNAEANQAYYLQFSFNGVTARVSPIKWELSVPKGTPAKAGMVGKELILSPADAAAAVYVYAPDEMKLNLLPGEGALTVQTQTTEQMANLASRAAGQAARGALQTALERYQATQVLKMNDGWQFATDSEKTGLQQGFAKPDFADRSWKTISTVGTWQSQGFEDYHGTAWYRKTINLSATALDPKTLDGKRLILAIGSVDGTANFYLNGEKFGQHILSDPGTDWQVPMAFDVTDLLRPGKNTLAVQVTKNEAASGIYKGVSLLSGTFKK